MRHLLNIPTSFYMKKTFLLLFSFLGTIAGALAQSIDLVNLLNRADSLHTVRNLAEADNAFSEIIKIKPDWAIPYAKRALVRVDLSQFSESRNDIVKAQDLDATNRIVVAAKKRYDEALDAATNPAQSKTAAPNQAITPQKSEVTDEGQTRIAGSRAGSDEAKTRKFEKPVANRATDNPPAPVDNSTDAPLNSTATTSNTKPENRIDRGLTRAEKIAQYTHAILQNPNDDQAYAERGLQYGILGNDAAALQDYNTALQINPNNGNAYYLRGVYYVTKNSLTKNSRSSRAKGCADLQRAAALGMKKATVILAKECR
ncbi:MAG: hypothetical protein RI894_1414 [Bacteroidota bacterium]|jgi:tetratricopeptide (TPR) repeat protein